MFLWRRCEMDKRLSQHNLNKIYYDSVWKHLCSSEWTLRKSKNLKMKDINRTHQKVIPHQYYCDFSRNNCVFQDDMIWLILVEILWKRNLRILWSLTLYVLLYLDTYFIYIVKMYFFRELVSNFLLRLSVTESPIFGDVLI